MNRHDRYKDPEVITEYFLNKHASYITNLEEKNFLKRAILLAYEKHNKQFRESGEPYFYHLYETGKFLTKYKEGYVTVSAAFLHDIIEDQNYDEKKLEENFSTELAFLVKSLTKIDKFFSKMPRDELSNTNIKNLIIAMSKDIRVILIKIADRMHNMRTLAFLPYEKQIRIAKETFYIFCPIADRLGIREVANEFYDLSFYYLNMEEYIKIKEKYDYLITIDKNIIDKIILKIKNSFSKKTNIDILNIEGRNKSLWSIWNKIQEKDTKLYELYDLTAIRIIVKNKIACYEALGYIHQWFHPINNRFKDYIANPKPNLYQSLHTTVVIDSTITEIQIRSMAMDEFANTGIIAHWNYKKAKKTKLTSEDYRLSEVDNKLRLLWNYQNIDTIDKTSVKNTSDIYLKSINKDIFYKYIYVMTPNGKTIVIPAGSTILDFAFKIHTKLPFYAYSSKVNGEIKPLDYEPETGDVIEILKSNYVRCGQSYIQKVTNNNNKVRIEKFLKQKETENSNFAKETAQKQLNKLFKDNNIVENNKKNSLISELMKFLHEDKTTNFYQLFLNKRFKLKDVYSDYLKNVKQKLLKQQNKPKTSVNKKNYRYQDILFGENDLFVKYSFATCCLPVYNEKIIGFISKAKLIKVHKADCINIMNETKSQRIIDCNWNPDHDCKTIYLSQIDIDALYTTYTFNKINKKIIELNLVVKEVKIREINNMTNLKINIWLYVTNIEKIRDFFSKLKLIKEVKKAERHND